MFLFQSWNHGQTISKQFFIKITVEMAIFVTNIKDKYGCYIKTFFVSA